MKSDQRWVITIIIPVALIVIVWLVYMLIRVNPSILPSNLTAQNPVGQTQGLKTWEPAPPNTSVPGQGASGVSPNVAVPDTVLSASIGSDANFRIFRISVKNNAFSPDTIVARQGDTMRLYLSALDRDYDFVQPDMGLSSKLPMGVERIIEFNSVTAGKFTFYCASCGGPGKGPLGYIIVVPR
jgi:heme/copper-type cytochrome/quinol oxidase subunit 2